MKEIKLTQGKIALIDDEDFEELSRYKWCAKKNRKTFYAIRGIKKTNGKWTTLYMHRFILRESNSLVITDHKDENGLNNQKYNLRPCTASKNKMNRGKQANNTSGFKGVSWHKRMKKWKAEIEAKGKIFFLGLFLTPEEAYKAYCEAAQKHHKEFAHF